jgi:hypothetical protein
MYNFHYDHLNGQWNVFFEHDGKQDYICSFYQLNDAQDYCSMNNGVLEAVNAKSSN